MEEQKQPKNRSFLKMIAAGMIGSALTFGIITQTDYFQPGSEQQDTPKQETSEATTAEPIMSKGSVADIAEEASDAIVGIVNMSEQQQNPFQQTNGEEVQKGVGSGVIYQVEDDEAYIVTNNHVIEGASSIQVSLSNGESVEGELVGTDPLTDIAVVKIKGDYDINPLEFGDSDGLRAGEEVIAIGNPLGLDLSRTVTQGIISAMDRTITVNTSAGEWDFDVIQTDAAINPGNSGGALIDGEGKVIGINSLKIASNGAEGLGFAIPSNQVEKLIEELTEKGKIERPYVGVGLKSVNEIPPYYLQDLPEDVKAGAVVLSVDEKSSAGKADIQIEDVIVAINGEKVKNDHDFRSYLYKELSIGDKATLKIFRNGKPKEVEITLTNNPS